MTRPRVTIIIVRFPRTCVYVAVAVIAVSVILLAR